MQLPPEDVVKPDHFVIVEAVLLPRGVTDQIQEQLEERALVLLLWWGVFGEGPPEHCEDGVEGVLEEDVGVVAGDEFVGDYD